MKLKLLILVQIKQGPTLAALVATLPAACFLLLTDALFLSSALLRRNDPRQTP